MKNSIKYFYNIDVFDINYLNNKYYFDNYILIEVNKPLDLELYSYIIQNNYPIYMIINNVNNEYISIIDNKKYILLNKNNLNNKIDIFNNLIINSSKEIRWDILWEYKVDYFEKNIVNINDKELLQVYPYYIGLSENAIRLFKEKEYDGNKSITHKRIESNDDLYIPSNIIIDYRVRDASEYIKYNFFNDTLDINRVFNKINSINYNNGDYYLLFTRLLFPTYFFDLLESNKKITIYSSKINQYELLLNKIYNYLNSYTKIPYIEWLIKR